jgi:hypothetical protein
VQHATREFAAHRNVNKSTITRWDQAGKIAWTPDGLIDFEKSAALIGEAADPARHGVTLRHAREREVKIIETELHGLQSQTDTPQRSPPPDGSPADPSGAAGTTYEAFNKARAEKEGELAKLAKIKREEQEGALVRRDDVQRDIESIATVVSKGLTGIPARVMPLLNAEPDPGKREAMLEEQIRQVLTEFADAALKFTES